ncbi:hypothetical protein C483_00919 [Natrialba hulunbeirensis JCM 10989]|uniref:CopG family transcriptional regulator n=1 Tax=Natrialba hulunbeirensis JCM 10989 TaxID=1227493 RepID=M0AEA1_9EURY|nr:ribbon-helix-helix domain-containing protein [Natrialba hulunbeirensis]ELY95663.1 hypothetical protein C483_00919 [Natrialba hulunbeirensis JCM 10989]
MSTANDTGDATTKIDVRVPDRLLEKIDEEYERRGDTSQSGAVRDCCHRRSKDVMIRKASMTTYSLTQ